MKMGKMFRLTILFVMTLSCNLPLATSSTRTVDDYFMILPEYVWRESSWGERHTALGRKPLAKWDNVPFGARCGADLRDASGRFLRILCPDELLRNTFEMRMFKRIDGSEIVGVHWINYNGLHLCCKLDGDGKYTVIEGRTTLLAFFSLRGRGQWQDLTAEVMDPVSEEEFEPREAVPYPHFVLCSLQETRIDCVISPEKAAPAFARRTITRQWNGTRFERTP